MTTEMDQSFASFLKMIIKHGCDSPIADLKTWGWGCSEMKTTRKYELVNILGREDFNILAVKRGQANIRLEEEVLPKSASVSSGRNADENDDGNHNIL
jgi:hypothetical protein